MLSQFPRRELSSIEGREAIMAMAATSSSYTNPAFAATAAPVGDIGGPSSTNG